MAPRVRREVWAISNDAADETLRWYAVGVGKMQARPIADHRSWRFQAAIHEYIRARDPLRVQGEAMPSPADQDAYWSQCQHGSWFFLPWHRMYLHHFEAILRKDIADAGGPSDWALPYWNYDATDDVDQARRIPPAFRNRFLDDNTTRNPLFVAARSPIANAGEIIADEFDVDSSDALGDPLFSDGPNNGAFGGPETGFMHGGDVIGQLERTPHGSMHVVIGGSAPPGWMSRFFTAALDPLFWLHHANVDRLWDVWVKRNAAHANPSSSMWLDTEFHFRSVDGADVVMTPADVVDTASAALDYRYDDVSDPLPAAPGGFAVPPDPMATSKSKLVGATDKPFEIGPTPHRAVVATHTAHSVTDAQAAPAGFAARRRVFVQFEHLTSDTGAAPYDIYLGVPEGEDPRAHPDKRIGRLPLFGLVEASSKEGPHAGSGLTYSLEITDRIDGLRQSPAWNPDRLPVLFVPVQSSPDARVRVGRVSLYAE